MSTWRYVSFQILGCSLVSDWPANGTQATVSVSLTQPVPCKFSSWHLVLPSVTDTASRMCYHVATPSLYPVLDLVNSLVPLHASLLTVCFRLSVTPFSWSCKFYQPHGLRRPFCLHSFTLDSPAIAILPASSCPITANILRDVMVRAALTCNDVAAAAIQRGAW
jgi:hypothetical protein